MLTEVLCPYCSEAIELEIYESGGRTQRYVEDCAVCCQPIEIHAVAEDEAFLVSVSRADD